MGSRQVAKRQHRVGQYKTTYVKPEFQKRETNTQGYRMYCSTHILKNQINLKWCTTDMHWSP